MMGGPGRGRRSSRGPDERPAARYCRDAALPNERDIAEEFGIGRATLRVALRLLETQGVLRINPAPAAAPSCAGRAPRT